MKKSLSIHDLARHLNVSATTVSFVLNGKAEANKIRPEVVAKIQAYIKEVGYRPNMVAKSLRTGKTKLIGMLVEGISDPFFSSIARIVEAEAYKAGYKLFYASTDNEPQKAKALIQAFRERQVDAYIVAPTPGIEDEIEALLGENSPVILFDRYFPSLPTTNVVINNYKGAFEATAHLAEIGCKNIGFVTLESDQVQMLDRLKGYSDAVKKQGTKAAVMKVTYSLAPSENIDAIKSFLERSPQLDALFFATNYLTIAGLQALKNLNRSVPGDLAVISFDDNSHFDLFSPSVSAVAQPVEEISQAIVKQLKLRLSDAGKSSKAETIVLPTKLIVRESTVSKINPQPSKPNAAKAKGGSGKKSKIKPAVIPL